MDERLYRLVIVTRKTGLELLLERHGTLGQARFYLRSRGQDIGVYVADHERFTAALNLVLAAIPPDRRRVRVDRGDLDRFLFNDDDLILVVGQDGLVPNTAKYLRGQLIVGINPNADRYDGVLCPHAPAAAGDVLAWVEQPRQGSYRVERRTMVVAEREDGQRLLALNEVFIGHRSHQSARYRLRVGEREERQSSSGIICSTGTGSTGWAKSIARQIKLTQPLPQPEERRLAWFVREPFPSVYTGADLDQGFLGPGEQLEVVSEMGVGGVIFGDGIETDNIEFLDGQQVTVRIAAGTANLVMRQTRG